jgi:hypothetical protein
MLRNNSTKEDLQYIKGDNYYGIKSTNPKIEVYGVLTPLSTIFHIYCVVSFISGGNQRPTTSH